MDSYLNRPFSPDRVRLLAQQALRTGRRVAAWALSALIVLQLVAFGAWWLGSAATRGPSGAALAARKRPTATELADQIIAARLFGSAPPENAHEGAADSSRHYALKGIVYLGASGDGFAILTGEDGRSRTFRTGESIAAGLTLHEVNADSVVLADDAQLRRLTLPHGALLLTQGLVAGAAAAPTPEAGTALTADTRATLDTFGLSVVQDGSGAISGLAGKGSESWHRSGLLPTDVIVAIDGTPVADVLQEPYAIDRAGMAAVTTLTVVRDGVSTTIEAEPARDAPAGSRRRAGG